MGAFDWLDKAGDWTEKKFDQGKKKLGEAVEWSTDHIGEGLDAVGAHHLARKVEHWGDEAASDLGAAVGEQQLGHTDDPKELVHGDVKRIDSVVKSLRGLHSSFDTANSGLQKVHATDWKGEGSRAFTAKFAPEPAKWARAADACESAAVVLESYAHTVTWAQGQAEEAIRLYKKGKAASKKAADEYNAKADAYNAKLHKGEDPGPRPGKFEDPGLADVKEAQRLLSEARKQRNTVAGEATEKIAKAVAHAPKKPAFHNRMEGDAKDIVDGGSIELLHFGGGIVRSGTDLVKFARTLNPYDTYNITHPAEYLNGVSNTAAGLLSLASHPERLPAAVLGTGWGSDPSEAAGRLTGNLLTALVTGGGSTAATMGERVAIGGAKRGAEEAAESGAARASLNRSPQDLARDNSTKVCLEDPVDIATGRMLLPQTDVVLPGALPLVFSRHFESSYRAGRWFGPAWASTADQRLEIDAEGVVHIGEDGVLLAYPHPAPGLPTLPVNGRRRPLERTPDGSYTLSDPDGRRTWRFRPYDEGLALLAELTDHNGHRITFGYAPDGTPTDIVHDAGRHIRITTDAGRITALHLAGAHAEGTDAELIRYGYTDGNLTEIVNSSGQPLRFGYDEHGRITSWTDRNGSGFDYVYDDRDRCVAQSGSGGHLRSRFAYDGTDPETGLRVTTLTDSLGHLSRYVIDDALRVVAEHSPTGAVTRFQWDRFNRLLSRTDPLGHTTGFRYDDHGRLLAVVRPDGRESTATYNDLGLPESATQPDGTGWEQTFDAAGNRTSLTDPSGATTHYTHDPLGHPASVTDALGNTTTVRCDAAGLPVEITDPLGGTTRYRRDAFGRITAITDPLGATTRLSWTTEGQLTRRLGPDGAAQSWTYDGEGNCTSHTDALGAVTTYEYTHFDLLTARTDPDGARHEFTHDPALRLTEVTNSQGLTWSYEYDPAGRIIAETDFDGRTLTYGHDAAGRLVTRTNALGETVGYRHDELGRLVAKSVDGRTTTYAYDVAGHLQEASDPETSLIRRRDRLGRIKSETVDGRTITFAYDELGRRTRRITPSGATSSWAYDAAGRPASITASGHRFGLEHDAAGREIARHFGRGITLGHEWDAAGQLTVQSLTAATRLQHRSYAYRADGHLTGITDQHTGSRTFELDAAGRVTAVNAPGWTERYAYDPAGNQTAAGWPAAHSGAEAQGPRSYHGTRITRAGAVRYEHDAQGRIVLRRKTRLSRKPDTWRYTWDAEDRLTDVTTPDGTRWHYRYDPLGRRMAKQRLTATGEIAEQVDFTWDGLTLAEQTSTATGLPNAVTLTWDHYGPQPIAQTERISAAQAPQQDVDQRFFAMVTDLIGTPSELVDEDGGTAWRTRTTLWGTTAWSADSTAYTPLRFPGQYFDPETGLHYNLYRHYDPETARYLTPDPLGLAPAPNPAAYVHNPHLWADPLGLAPCKPSLLGRLKGMFNRGDRPEAGAAVPETAQPPRMLEAGPPGIGEPAELYGPYHRLSSRTQTPEVTQMVVESGELWGRESRWGGEPMVQAHRGPMPENARPGSFEFYTSSVPKPEGRTQPGYVAWEVGTDPGVQSHMVNGEEFARIPVFVTKVR